MIFGSMFVGKNYICTRKSPNKNIIDQTRSVLWEGRPIKNLLSGLVSAGGRNHTGRQTVLHRGGGHKQLYRAVQLKDTPNKQIFLEVLRTEYDPNRTSWISLVTPVNDMDFIPDGNLISTNTGGYTGFYILSTNGLSVGSVIEWGPGSEVKDGNRVLLSSVPPSESIHSVEIRRGGGSVLARAAGTRCKLLEPSINGKKALVLLPSGKKMRIPGNVFATVGRVSNWLHNQKVLRKAGVSRWLGRRPVVRGIAKNPVDHPHGGRTNGGCHPKTPWGKLTRGVPTRKKTKSKLL